MWIGKYMTGSFRDQYEVVYGLEQMIVDDNMTIYEVLSRF
jgi:hypothetical protein